MPHSLSIRQQLSYLLFCSITLFLLFFSGMMIWQEQQLQQMKAQQAQTFQKSVKQVFDRNGAQLQSVAADYSLWDETFDFIHNPDLEWARINIDESLPSYNIQHSWLIDLKGNVIYSFHDHQELSLPINPRQLFNASRQIGLHGFAITTSHEASKLIEIRAMSINHSDDYSRNGKIAGWLLVAQEIDDTTLSELQVQMSADFVSIENTNPTPHNLNDWMVTTNIPLATFTHGTNIHLYAAKSLKDLQTLHKVHLHAYYFSLLALAIILLLNYVILRNNLLRPMSDIIYALDNNSISGLKQHTDKTNEIGKLSQLIIEFFKHKQSVLLELKTKKSLLKDVQSSNQELLKVSRTDELTQIGNRRTFDECLVACWQQAIVTESDLSIVMIDIDFFKSYNDYYGHPQGDQCLKSVASLMQSCLHRGGDILTRYGGEEFALILPSTTTSGASTLALRLIEAIDRANIPHAKSSVADHVTISAGVASMQAYPGSKPEMLLALADGALYEAKAKGRNCLRTDEDLISSTSKHQHRLTLVVDNPDKDSA